MCVWHVFPCGDVRFSKNRLFWTSPIYIRRIKRWLFFTYFDRHTGCFKCFQQHSVGVLTNKKSFKIGQESKRYSWRAINKLVFLPERKCLENQDCILEQIFEKQYFKLLKSRFKNASNLKIKSSFHEVLVHQGKNLQFI